MDLNRFLKNVDATNKVINKGTNHVMLSTLSNLEDTWSQGEDVFQDIQNMIGAITSAQGAVESAIIKLHNADTKVTDENGKIDDLREQQEREMEQAQAEFIDATVEYDEARENYNEERSHYDDAEYDLSYWEGQGMQIVNTLNNQISALVSGAEALGIDISVDKYVNLRNKLEDNLNHEKIDWATDSRV